MPGRYEYVTLAASLPYLGRLFTEAHLPISRFRLEARLDQLSAEHRTLLDEIVAAIAWDRVAQLDSDAQIIDRCRQVMERLEAYPALQEILRARLEMRTIVAALRRRHDGAVDAGEIADWGYGRWLGTMRANWSDPAFGLGHFMPWVGEAQAKLMQDDRIGLERVILSEGFRQMDRLAEGHEFDFEAVVIYVLRWRLVERWRQYDAERATARLGGLLDAAMDAAPSDGIAAGVFTHREIAS
ncbi:hypothetical protein H1W37_00325 [Stappia taiwanensis]|uniref:DUF2764 domain-containing protein n=1 Tax=Stappia taiwanensis TaxID=992267 RepID=A0A838XJN0_9HYPH|nr:hypothetical protein [Stappia taiwanensis]MBA4610077.1 hypothetical protein [Stappia taiwanensis]GGE76741.1 hypothetical protein GCM10007285_00630 [Stappia taiwanensis]